MRINEIKKESIEEVLSIINEYVKNHDVINEYDIQDILDEQLKYKIGFVEFNVLCDLLQMQNYKVDYSDISINGKHDFIRIMAFQSEELELLSMFAEWLIQLNIVFPKVLIKGYLWGKNKNRNVKMQIALYVHYAALRSSLRANATLS